MKHIFILSQADSRPMYLQIIEQIKNRIAVGDWQQGYKLPSIRELAVSLKVSVITVKRAYQELDAEGVILTQHGKGSFVAAGINLNKQLKQQEIQQHLTAAIAVARSIGMGITEIVQQLEQLMNPAEPKKKEINDE